MFYIHFETEKEASKLLEIVSVHPLGTELNSYIELHEGKLFIKVRDNCENKMGALLSDVFYSFLLQERLSAWLEQIVQQKFYFQERDEIDSIIDIARSIIEANMEYSQANGISEEKKIVMEGLSGILAEKSSFAFDSFAKFRLKGFYDSLFHYVELAIDEYKLEQDYQNFVATLRDFMSAQDAKMKKLHLLYANGFSFFDGSFRKLDKQDLMKLLDRKLLAENPVYIDSTTIAPLISIAPEQLILYTDETEEGLVQTIIRIFEERATIRTVDRFYRDQQESAFEMDGNEAL